MPSKWDAAVAKREQQLAAQIDRLYTKAVNALCALDLSRAFEDDALFSFSADIRLEQQAGVVVDDLYTSVLAAMQQGVRDVWEVSDEKAAVLVKSACGTTTGELGDEFKHRYLSNNDTAMTAFLERKAGGLSLSQRVWRYTSGQFRAEIELAIDVALREGKSANELSRDVRAFLQNPDALFRRVRDKHGRLVLSQAAKAYHPGRGVYRSSYKNAKRLASTEINMAYHRADLARWEKLDFVVGYKVVTSNNHPQPDICDELKGDYPKTFVFVGWHPHCRCHAEPILKTPEEVDEDNARLLKGEQVATESVNTVNSVPSGFTAWVMENAEKIERARSLPYFLSDNRFYVKKILER